MMNNISKFSKMICIMHPACGIVRACYVNGIQMGLHFTLKKRKTHLTVNQEHVNISIN